MAKRLGIATELPAVNSLVLGSGDVSVLDMATAYSTWRTAECASRRPSSRESNRSKRTATSPCWSSTNRVASRSSLPRWQTPSPTACAKWSLGGTGSSAAFGKASAGKTGTTQDNRDAWFVGYTPKLTAAVWMGYPGTGRGTWTTCMAGR